MRTQEIQEHPNAKRKRGRDDPSSSLPSTGLLLNFRSMPRQTRIGTIDQPNRIQLAENASPSSSACTGAWGPDQKTRVVVATTWSGPAQYPTDPWGSRCPCSAPSDQYCVNPDVVGPPVIPLQDEPPLRHSSQVKDSIPRLA